MDTSKLPRFDPDKPIVCPKCGAKDDLDEYDLTRGRQDYEHSWWLNHDGIWYFTCFDCGHEWKAIAERKEK